MLPTPDALCHISLTVPTQALASGSQIQSILLDGSYKAEQLHNVISRCSQLAAELSDSKYIRKQKIIRTVVDRVDLHEDQIVIKIDNRSLLNAIRAESSIQPSSSDLVIQRQAIRLCRGKALRLVIPATSPSDIISLCDEKLVTLIAESRAIMSQFNANPNKTIAKLAFEQGRCRVRMMKVAKLACLDPDIVTAIVEGRQPLQLTSGKLLAADLPLAWTDQKRALGFS